MSALFTDHNRKCPSCGNRAGVWPDDEQGRPTCPTCGALLRREDRDAARAQELRVLAVRSVDELWAWMNTWGELLERHRAQSSASRDWREGYSQAIRDLYDKLAEMGVENCSDEAWARFTGRG